MKCRHCNSKLENEFIDLGNAPPSNNYVSQDKLKLQERSYPLRVMVCSNCWLVQTEDFSDADELFTDEYAYFSSTSISFLEHAKNYVHEITKFLQLNQNSFVVELASNDGYLLKNFVELGIPCLGIEPTKSTANVSREKGIETIEEFFWKRFCKKIKSRQIVGDMGEENLVCSFCQKSRRNVSKMIVGTEKVAICNECIKLCNEILAEDLNKANKENLKVGNTEKIFLLRALA